MAAAKSSAASRVRPLGDRVLIRRVEAEEQKVGSLYVPDTAKEKPMQAEVLAVGEGKIDSSGERIPVSVEKGQKVLISKYAGTDLTVEGEELVIIRESDILAIVE